MIKYIQYFAKALIALSIFFFIYSFFSPKQFPLTIEYSYRSKTGFSFFTLITAFLTLLYALLLFQFLKVIERINIIKSATESIEYKLKNLEEKLNN